jgi:flagellar hook-length control protein FliK
LPAELIAESDRPSESEAIKGISIDVAAVETSEPAQAATAEVNASGIVDTSEPPANVDTLVSETQTPAVTESGLSSPQAVQTLVVDPAIGAQQRPRNVYGTLGERPHAGRGPLPLAIDTARLLNRVARAFTSARERDGEIRLRLSPDELGSLRLEIQVEEGAVVAKVEAETAAAQTAILDQLPVLRERLAELGMRIERFDVDLIEREAGHWPQGSPEQERSQPRTALVPAAPRGRTEAPAAAGTESISPAPLGRLNVIV